MWFTDCSWPDLPSSDVATSPLKTFLFQQWHCWNNRFLQHRSAPLWLLQWSGARYKCSNSTRHITGLDPRGSNSTATMSSVAGWIWVLRVTDKMWAMSTNDTSHVTGWLRECCSVLHSSTHKQTNTHNTQQSYKTQQIVCCRLVMDPRTNSPEPAVTHYLISSLLHISMIDQIATNIQWLTAKINLADDLIWHGEL